MKFECKASVPVLVPKAMIICTYLVQVISDEEQYLCSFI
jgi:hypothetical protein